MSKKKVRKQKLIITMGAILDEKNVFIRGVGSDMEYFEPWSRIIHWQYPERIEVKSFDIALKIRHLVRFESRAESLRCMVGLTEEGEVLFFTDSGIVTEKITVDGVETWFRMNKLAQIGEHLYVCGEMGQIYKRVSKNQWIHKDEGILVPKDRDSRRGIPENKSTTMTAEELLQRIEMQRKNYEEDMFLILAINGLSEDDIYIAGAVQIKDNFGLEGMIYHNDGGGWQRIGIPESGMLNTLYIENKDSIWACGINGSFLHGNAKDGFQEMSAPNDTHSFSTITKYQGEIYVGANDGIYKYTEGRLNRVLTGLKNEPNENMRLDSDNQYLWAFGRTHVLQFDGHIWREINLTHSAPIPEGTV